MRKQIERPVFLAILLFGVLLRLFRLGYQSVWNDEALSITVASGSVQQILSNDFHSLHPPAYYLLLHFWRDLLGDSDAALRLLSAFMGIGGIAAIYYLGKLLFKPEVGLWAAAITAVMPFHLFYSQEIRSYTQLFLLSTLAILVQIKIWQGKGKQGWWWLSYLTLTLIGLYTHYLFGLITGTLGLFYLFRWWQYRTTPHWKQFLLAHIGIAVLYAPILFWLQDQLNQSSDYWISEATLAGFLSLPLSFTAGQFLDRVPLMVAYGLILSLMMIALLQAARALFQRTAGASSLALILMAYWVPVTLLFVVSLVWKPLTLPRLMTVAVPGLYLFLAWGASLTKEKRLNAVLLLMLMGVSLMADYNWLFNERFHKPPAREAAYFLQEMVSQEGTASSEVIIFSNDSGFRLFNRYTPALDHRLYLDRELIDNPQVRPEVIRLMGGEIVPPDQQLAGHFWLVLHQDFEVEEQEEIYNRFVEQYGQLAAHEMEGIRLYHFQGQGK